ncbi:MAG TPA: hypothetical protein VF456_08595 [Vicinamibacterales bacterium]
MPDFNVRSDSVNVEQIMEQIRARIREKRGADYTEQQIQELAAVKLEKFLDPRGVRSDLLEQFRKAQPPYSPPELPNYAFEDVTLFESHRLPLRLIRKILRPILKLFFNPNPLIQALNIQSRLNTMYAEREARREAARHAFDQLHYEVMHNLVLETTRLGIEVKNLKMRVESLTSRLEFNERRARALESVVVYKPSSEDRLEPAPVKETRIEEPAPVNREAARPAVPGGQQAQPEGPGQRSRRRRRRRGRRGGGGSAASLMGGAPATGQAAPGSSAEGTQEPPFTADVNHETDQADHDESPDLEHESVGEPDAAGSEPDDHEQ